MNRKLGKFLLLSSAVLGLSLLSPQISIGVYAKVNTVTGLESLGTADTAGNSDTSGNSSTTGASDSTSGTDNSGNAGSQDASGATDNSGGTASGDTTGTESAEAKVKVVEKTYAITTYHPTNYKKTSVGEKLQIKITKNSKKVSYKNLKFKSSDKKVATISSKGIITPRKNGTTVITVSHKKYTDYKCKIYLIVADKSVRTLYYGDSRSVDLFTPQPGHILGKVSKGMVVYAMDGGRCYDMEQMLYNYIDLDDYDYIVSWMGANNYGNFNPYKKLYAKLLKKKKKLILCTVGPSKDEYLVPGDENYFGNYVINVFNRNMRQWASEQKNVKIIDLHHYLVKNNVNIESRDGVHYLPKPYKVLWNYIAKKVKKYIK